MSCDHSTLVRAAERLYRDQPFARERAVAAKLGISRQTLWRALKDGRTSHEDLQRNAIFGVLTDIMVRGRLESWKQVAGRLSCSTRTLIRWVERFEDAHGVALHAHRKNPRDRASA